MRALTSTLRFIWNHPLNQPNRLAALGRFARWQISARLAPGYVAFPFVEKSLLLASQGMTGATGNYYCGLHELSAMGLVLHALRDEDLFLDVGANIGSYTVLAAGAVGSRVISVEPIPETCKHLRRNIAVNGLEPRVVLVEKGLGSQEGTLRFTTGMDTVNHVATEDETCRTVLIPVTTVDRLCAEALPTVIKIDVEGFEHQVIAGAESTLSSKSVLAVIMETNHSGERYGESDDALVAKMRAFGFMPCGYNAITRDIAVEEIGLGNTIFIRDPGALMARLKCAKRYRLINGEI